MYMYVYIIYIYIVCVYISYCVMVEFSHVFCVNQSEPLNPPRNTAVLRRQVLHADAAEAVLEGDLYGKTTSQNNIIYDIYRIYDIIWDVHRLLCIHRILRYDIIWDIWILWDI